MFHSQQGTWLSDRQDDVYMKLEQRSPWNWKAEPEVSTKANKLNLQLLHLIQNSLVPVIPSWCWTISTEYESPLEKTPSI